jgi:hypothetical protein
MESPALRLRFATQDGIRVDLLKAIHIVLLAELPREAVLDFWARHPFTLFHGPLAPKAFFRYLWESGYKVPPPYFWSVVADLEPFLAGKGIRAERFFRLLNHGPGGGPPLDREWVPGSLLPGQGSPPEDLRGWLLAELPFLTRRLLPGCRMDAIGSGSSLPGGRGQSRLFLFQPMMLAPESAVPDFRLFPGKLLSDLPKLFGCAAFDKLDVEADMRNPAACLGRPPDGAWNWKGDLLRLGRRRMGRLESLDQALEAWPDAAAARSALDGFASRPVLRMERDFAPAGARAARLHAGRIYGSPVFLVRIGYSGNRCWERWAAWLRQDPPRFPEARRPWEMAERLHRELIDGLD